MLWKQSDFTDFCPGKTKTFISWLGSSEAQRRLCFMVKYCFEGCWVIDAVKTCREMLHWNEKFVLWRCCSWVWSCRTLQVFKKSNSLFLFASFNFFKWLQRLWLSTNRSWRILEFKKIAWGKRSLKISKCITAKLKVNPLVLTWNGS